MRQYNEKLLLDILGQEIIFAGNFLGTQFERIIECEEDLVQEL